MTVSDMIFPSIILKRPYRAIKHYVNKKHPCYTIAGY